MSSVLILDNPTIHTLLINLSPQEATTLQSTIENTFLDFSINNERAYQPLPSSTNRPNGQNTLFRPFTSNSCIGAKITVEPAPAPDGSKDPLHGVIVLCDGRGVPRGLLSSEEITGYRTAMNAMVPFTWRRCVETVLVFGAGVQALWHVRMVLMLRGKEVKRVVFVSRSRGRVQEVIARVEGENQARWKSGCVFGFVDPGDSREVEAYLGNADCVLCTTPAVKPLFAAEACLKMRSGNRQPFISAVGSWQPRMIELDPVLLRSAVADGAGYNPVTGENKGVIFTDDRDFALQNAGELVQGGIEAKDVVELGEIIALRKGRGSTESEGVSEERRQRMERFIAEGFVVFKSIGVSLTDLRVSEAIVDLYKRKQEQ